MRKNIRKINKKDFGKIDKHLYDTPPKLSSNEREENTSDEFSYPKTEIKSIKKVDSVNFSELNFIKERRNRLDRNLNKINSSNNLKINDP